MKRMHCVSFLPLMLVLAPVRGFGVQPKGSLSSMLSENSRRRSSLQYQNDGSPTNPATKINEEEDTEIIIEESSILINDDESDWDLREDWALQDSVPRYTIGTDVGTATFWTQLRHSTPELAARTEAELEERYREWYSSEEDSLAVECGPSPILLSDWRVSTAAPLPTSSKKKTTPSTTMMSGSLPNGSQIWFPLKCAGTLGDDPMNCPASSMKITQDTLDDCFISASMTMHTSSYAESTGGIVYELGAPRCEAHRDLSPRHTLDAATGISSASNSAVAEESAKTSQDIADHLDKFKKNLVSAATSNVGTVSAIVAASTVSACLTLGYADSPIPGSPSVTQNRQGDVVAARTERVYFNTGADCPDLSISERRARAELKVGRDKRRLVMMQERLHRDEARLLELRQEESLQQE